jgi:predicted DNA-binding transcriptional regulator AlpA
MSTIEIDTASNLLPTRAVCRRYGVSDRTVMRWERDTELNFPAPLKINDRKYWREADLTNFDRARVAQR